jgi:hypothetical protein
MGLDDEFGFQDPEFMAIVEGKAQPDPKFISHFARKMSAGSFRPTIFKRGDTTAKKVKKATKVQSEFYVPGATWDTLKKGDIA